MQCFQCADFDSFLALASCQRYSFGFWSIMDFRFGDYRLLTRSCHHKGTHPGILSSSVSPSANAPSWGARLVFPAGWLQLHSSLPSSFETGSP